MSAYFLPSAPGSVSSDESSEASESISSTNAAESPSVTTVAASRARRAPTRRAPSRPRPPRSVRAPRRARRLTSPPRSRPITGPPAARQAGQAAPSAGTSTAASQANPTGRIRAEPGADSLSSVSSRESGPAVTSTPIAIPSEPNGTRDEQTLETLGQSDLAACLAHRPAHTDRSEPTLDLGPR